MSDADISPKRGAESRIRRGDGATERALKLAALREHSLLSLSELSQGLTATPDLFHMADLVLLNLMGQFGTSKSALWVVSPTGNDAVFIRGHGVQSAIARRLGDALVALARSETVLSEPLTCRALGAVYGADIESLAVQCEVGVVAPIVGNEGLLGLVALGPRIARQDYGLIELKTLHTASSVLGVAIQNLALMSRMVEANRELRGANEELRELDRLKSELLSNVSHELRTPLTVIIGFAETLREMGDRPEAREAMTSAILEKALDVNEIVSKLLAISESRNQLVEMACDDGDVAACVQRYCEERQALASTQLREFTWRIDPDLPWVRFDEGRLAQAIEAIVDNAIKFTPEGAKVEVRVRSSEANGIAGVAIEVSDTGPGMSPEILQHLFEVFRQGDGSATRAAGGLGIGLAFSRQLVEAMGGKISARSKAGQGTTFTVFLPAASSPHSGNGHSEDSVAA